MHNNTLDLLQEGKNFKIFLNYETTFISGTATTNSFSLECLAFPELRHEIPPSCSFKNSFIVLILSFSQNSKQLLPVSVNCCQTSLRGKIFRKCIALLWYPCTILYKLINLPVTLYGGTIKVLSLMKYANISKDYSELPTMQDTYCSASLSVV